MKDYFMDKQKIMPEFLFITYKKYITMLKIL